MAIKSKVMSMIQEKQLKDDNGNLYISKISSGIVAPSGPDNYDNERWQKIN